jgi:DNA polymerase-1
MVAIATPEAVHLFHEGTLAFAQVEANGLRVDEDYITKTRSDLRRRITDMQNELRDTDVYKIWRRQYGSNANLGSRPQLANILFNVMGYECRERTPTGKPRANEEAFEYIDNPFVKKYVRIAKLQKAEGTFLKGIQDEVVEGFVHPNIGLNIPQSYRSQSDNPNSQNWPIRDEEMAKLIRQCFISRRRKDGRILEVDFSGAEVRVSVCYNGDPVLKAYVLDPTKDMHRDMAMQLYKLKQNQVDKKIRHAAKNKFVFPQFYGDYYIHCAKHLWGEMELRHFTVDGKPLREHLAAKGINRLGDLDPSQDAPKDTFEYHVRQVEKDFWENRFRVYTQWKEDTWQQYLQDGYFQMFTGFVVGPGYNRKQVLNYGIQGSSFHCLLWCLIKLQKWLTKNKMLSRIVGQIHDSIILDVVDSELPDILAYMKELMTVKLAKHWKWLTVPMSAEAEVAPIGAPWHDKKKVEDF